MIGPWADAQQYGWHGREREALIVRIEMTLWLKETVVDGMEMEESSLDGQNRKSGMT